jgi:hypothetical protein
VHLLYLRSLSSHMSRSSSFDSGSGDGYSRTTTSVFLFFIPSQFFFRNWSDLLFMSDFLYSRDIQIFLFGVRNHLCRRQTGVELATGQLEIKYQFLTYILSGVEG